MAREADLVDGVPKTLRESQIAHALFHDVERLRDSYLAHRVGFRDRATTPDDRLDHRDMAVIDARTLRIKARRLYRLLLVGVR